MNVVIAVNSILCMGLCDYPLLDDLKVNYNLQNLCTNNQLWYTKLLDPNKANVCNNFVNFLIFITEYSLREKIIIYNIRIKV